MEDIMIGNIGNKSRTANFGRHLFRTCVFAFCAVLTFGCGKKTDKDDDEKKADKIQKTEEKEDGESAATGEPGDTEQKGAPTDPGEEKTAKIEEATEGGEEKPILAPRPGSIQAQMILIAWKGEATDAKRTQAQAETLAKKVAEEAKKGDFDELVEKYSDGSKVNKGKTPPMAADEAAPIFKPVFDLKVGEVTGPIKASSGYYVFKRTK
jgi:parvulin-like peptidyl-prolyl isomerase